MEESGSSYILTVAHDCLGEGKENGDEREIKDEQSSGKKTLGRVEEEVVEQVEEVEEEEFKKCKMKEVETHL